jgi:hypothetical protein
MNFCRTVSFCTKITNRYLVTFLFHWRVWVRVSLRGKRVRPTSLPRLTLAAMVQSCNPLSCYFRTLSNQSGIIYCQFCRTNNFPRTFYTCLHVETIRMTLHFFSSINTLLINIISQSLLKALCVRSACDSLFSFVPNKNLPIAVEKET